MKIGFGRVRPTQRFSISSHYHGLPTEKLRVHILVFPSGVIELGKPLFQPIALPITADNSYLDPLELYGTILVAE